MTKNLGRVSPGKPIPDKFQDDFNRLRDTIQENWRGSVEKIYVVAKACAEADRLPEEIKSRLKKSLPFNASVFSKLAKVGRDERLESLKEKLPPNWTSIYEVSLLDDKTLDIAIKTNRLDGSVKRSDITKLRKMRLSTPRVEGKVPEAEGYLTASFGPCAGVTDEQLEQLKERLISLAEEYGIKVAFDQPPQRVLPLLASPHIMPSSDTDSRLPAEDDDEGSR